MTAHAAIASVMTAFFHGQSAEIVDTIRLPVADAGLMGKLALEKCKCDGGRCVHGMLDTGCGFL